MRALEPGGSGEAATKTALDSEATARANADAQLTPKTRAITAGPGLTGGGDLSADRSFTVAYGTTAGTAAQGNDPRLSDARPPTAHATSHGSGGSDPITLAQSQVTGLAATLGNKADLVGGVIPTAQIPALAINETFTVVSQAAMLALTAQRGDVAIRTDLTPNRAFLLASDSPTTLADWKEITAAGSVTTVNGQSGVVVLSKADVGVVDATTGVKGLVQLAGDLAGSAASPRLAAGVAAGGIPGAAEDGVTDDTAAIQAWANTSPLGIVQLKKSYRITGTIAVPDGVTIAGWAGTTTITVDAGFNFAAFRINGTRGSVRDLKIVKAAGADAGPSGIGVYVIGNSVGSRVSNVIVDGMSNGFYVAGQNGTVPGTVKRIVFDRCQAFNSVVFGFEIDECDGLELAHCSSEVSGLDGVKLRRKTKNVVLTGGYYKGAVGGDGMDCYAGGNTFTIQGTVFADNTLNGLVVKNDDLNRTDPATYGYVRSLNITGVLATGNGGSGIACHRSSGNPDDPTEPLVSGVNIVACQLNGNANYGLYLNARRVLVSGVSAARNGLDGVYLEPTCRDIDLVGVHAAGNSLGNGFTAANTRDGIHIDGSRIRIFGGSSIGSDPDGARDDADIDAAAASQRYGLRVESTASEVEVWGLKMRNNLIAPVSDLSVGGIRTPEPSASVSYLDSGGKYVAPAGTRSTLPMAANVEYAVPIWLGNGATVVRLGCEVTVAGTAGTVIRLGLRSASNHSPGAVLGEATVAADAVASVEATVSIVVPSAGLYWPTATAQNTGAQLPTIRATTGNLPPCWSGSLANALSASAVAGYQTAATVTGALPGTYTVSNRVAAAPLVVIRS
ncbi:hypothetical protein [Actinoplanes sp. NPDC049316]|uniref:hypothetical protein n=1 Tax=Actinoplanes sp. NPDC049316 TaxID=3154727 RepID=UPI003432CC14